MNKTNENNRELKRTQQNSTPNIRWMLVGYDLIVYAVVAIILLVIYGGMDKLNYLMIPNLGYIAAAYTTVIGYAFSLIFHYMICKKTVYKSLFEKKVMVIGVGICFGAMILTLILYKNNTLRLFLIALIVLIIIVYGIINVNKFKDFFRK